MAWDLVDSGEINQLPLLLYRLGEDFMIRVDGLELMNSRWHRSEVALATVAKRVLTSREHATTTEKAESEASTAPARILIGGLGLGYTLAAFIEQFGTNAEIVVAEKSPDVIRWYDLYFREKTSGSGRDAAVTFLNRDVQDVIRDESAFDIIALDIDNGPEPVSGESNGRVYSQQGLQEIRSQLKSGGALLVWSAFDAPAFVEEALTASFVVTTVPCAVGLREHEHYIYQCEKL